MITLLTLLILVIAIVIILIISAILGPAVFLIALDLLLPVSIIMALCKRPKKEKKSKK